MLARWQQREWRDLRRRVDPVQVARKPADRAHPLSQVGVPDPGREHHPAKRRFDRDRRLAGVIEERHEAPQRPMLGDELETETATDRQVVVEVLLQRGHAAAPGHGWTSAASAPRSTLA